MPEFCLNTSGFAGSVLATDSWRSCAHSASKSDEGVCVLCKVSIPILITSDCETYLTDVATPKPPRPRARPLLDSLKPFCPAPTFLWSCMKKPPRLGTKAGSSSRFFLYSSCSFLLFSATDSNFACADSSSPTAGCPVTGPLSMRWSNLMIPSSFTLSDTCRPFIITSVSVRVEAKAEGLAGLT